MAVVRQWQGMGATSPTGTTVPTSSVPSGGQQSGLANVLNEAGSIISAAGNAIASIGGLFGSTGRFNNKHYQAAVRALGDACVTGIAAGHVESAEYLLGYLRPDLSNYAKSYFNELISRAKAAYPSLMAQAAQNPIAPSPDGYEPLNLLLQAGIPFNEPYMGYDTADIPASGEPPAPNPTTAAVVAQLQALHVQAAATGVLPGLSGLSGTPALLLGLGVVGAIWYAKKHGRR